MRNVTAAILPSLFLSAVPVLAPAAEQEARSWHFAVLLDGKHIGEHDFVLTRHGDADVIDIVAHFKVGVAFIPLYVYDHQNHEVWRNGCVVSVSSRTNDNGRKDFVDGAVQDQAFRVRSARGVLTLPACVRTFAYWDENLLAQPPLLNTQTGEFQAVTLTAAGVQSVTVAGRPLAAKRYSLRGPHLAIDVWYSEAGDWVALESKLESGRTLRYEIQ
jgi:hypothetical protein